MTTEAIKRISDKYATQIEASKKKREAAIHSLGNLLLTRLSEDANYPSLDSDDILSHPFKEWATITDIEENYIPSYYGDVEPQVNLWGRTHAGEDCRFTITGTNILSLLGI